MKLKPLLDKVIVKLLDAEEKTSGGIFLPETGQKQSHLAEVIAVGPGRFTESGQMVKPGVETGQKVVIKGEWAGENVTVEGVEYKIVNEPDILAIVE